MREAERAALVVDVNERRFQPVRDFIGHEPQIEPLLEKRGLTSAGN
ncbi:hypothetical protein [Stenotrophomonas indicatrix]|nr:hypothetical protein [Stenotrophomonas indicatrix]SET62740.1 hypothetical protein SAMN05720615_10617 [Stenotrophomonas indicatrix]